MNKNFDLSGMVALVTGGSQSIGLAIAKELGKAGAKLAILSRTETRLISACKEIVDETGAQCIWVKSDITDEKSIERAVSEVINHYGRIDILISNAAGSAPDIPIEDITMEDWKKCMSTNIDGMFIIAREVARQCMIPQKGGKITLLCSIASEIFNPTYYPGAYEISKGAISTMVKVLDANWNRYGIHVNGIAPGYTLSDVVIESFKDNPNAESEAAATVPVKRFAQPSEIAPAAVFLSSNGASYIHGSIITVDGGRTYM